ncbi:MAG: IS21 family transposase [Pirellulaceae bacterium]|nr:IS21 family transposase [Pirellulaceae bacterium]
MTIDPLVKNDIISRWKNRQSIRSIARDLHLGRAMIASVIRQHVAQTQTPTPASPACFGPIPLSRKSKLDPFLDSLKQLLERYPKITAQRAFEELRQLGFSGSYSTLRTAIKEQRLKPKAPVVRFETPSGAQGQMDWSPYTLDFSQEGRRRVELFSYILSYSRRQYICFTERQDFETTARCHIAAFEHLGGAAATCLYDNMKVVVILWEDGQPIYNPRFLSLATHYGFKPWACEPKRPETKGKIERPFDYVEKNLLNARTFRSLEHLNEVARWWLCEVNDRRIHGTTKRTPVELHEEEQPHLVALPKLRFDTAQVVDRKVDSEGLIQYAENRYSVPWRLIGQLVPVRILEEQLEIYNPMIELVATHYLIVGRNEKQVEASHLPPSDHHEQRLILREKYLHWGPVALEYFEGLLRKCRNGRHEAQRILSLLHGYSKKDGLAAMQRGIQYHAYGYQSLERILAHIGTPKAAWELLSQREQDALQRLTESTRVEARSSKEYQQLIDHEKEHKNHGESSPTQPTPIDSQHFEPKFTEAEIIARALKPTESRSPSPDSSLPGSTEAEVDGGAA